MRMQASFTWTLWQVAYALARAATLNISPSDTGAFSRIKSFLLSKLSWMSIATSSLSDIYVRATVPGGTSHQSYTLTRSYAPKARNTSKNLLLSHLSSIKFFWTLLFISFTFLVAVVVFWLQMRCCYFVSGRWGHGGQLYWKECHRELRTNFVTSLIYTQRQVGRSSGFLRTRLRVE